PVAGENDAKSNGLVGPETVHVAPVAVGDDSSPIAEPVRDRPVGLVQPVGLIADDLSLPALDIDHHGHSWMGLSDKVLERVDGLLPVLPPDKVDDEKDQCILVAASLAPDVVRGPVPVRTCHRWTGWRSLDRG